MNALRNNLVFGLVALLFSSVSTAALTVNVNPMTNLSYVNGHYEVLSGQAFSFGLSASDVSNIGGITMEMGWDSSKATLTSSSLPAIGNGPLAIGTGTFLIVNGLGGSRIVDILPGAPPVGGNFPLAVFTFLAGAPGHMSLLVSDDGGITSGWFDNNTAEPVSALYSNVDIQIVTPIPAAVWLFGSALGLLGWARRKAA